MTTSNVDVYDFAEDPVRSHDLQGREYANIKKLRAGDYVTVDDGFTCMREGSIHRVYENASWFARIINWMCGSLDPRELYVLCDGSDEDDDDGFEHVEHEHLGREEVYNLDTKTMVRSERHTLDGQMDDNASGYLIGMYPVDRKVKIQPTDDDF